MLTPMRYAAALFLGFLLSGNSLRANSTRFEAAFAVRASVVRVLALGSSGSAAMSGGEDLEVSVDVTPAVQEIEHLSGDGSIEFLGFESIEGQGSDTVLEQSTAIAGAAVVVGRSSGREVREAFYVLRNGGLVALDTMLAFEVLWRVEHAVGTPASRSLAAVEARVEEGCTGIVVLDVRDRSPPEAAGERTSAVGPRRDGQGTLTSQVVLQPGEVCAYRLSATSRGTATAVATIPALGQLARLVCIFALAAVGCAFVRRI